MLALVGIGFAIWWCWFYPPTVVQQGTTVSAFSITNNPPTITISGIISIQANYTGRVDISLLDSVLIVTYQSTLLGNVTIPKVGTIYGQKPTQTIAVPFNFNPNNPSSSAIVSMQQDISSKGYTTLNFNGYVNRMYILYPSQVPLVFSKNFP